MLKSMTGYGKAVVQLPTKKITVEIKSLNSKNLDINTRIPSQYRIKELEIRKNLATSLERGKIDFSLFIEVTAEETTTTLNAPVIKKYIEELTQIVDSDPTELLKMAVRLPDTLKTEREELDEDEYKIIAVAIQEALEAINQYRAQEGAVLEKEFLSRSQNIKNLLQEVIKIDVTRLASVRDRLEKAVSEIKENVDQNRFEQELIYYLEKFDISEEKSRLTNHLDYFNKTIQLPESNGKKLAFITQEIGREINTIGSKANFAPMQQLVVQMKDELEKIKEQALNVL
jgi:uncharacterized protein (TIGR00255 family)